MSSRDADRLFHETWLGLAQPIEGLVFSVPVLAEAQIAPSARPEITTHIRAQCEELPGEHLALRSVRGFFELFFGYDLPGSLIERDALPAFYAPESGQEVRASFAIARTPRVPNSDPFAEFSKPTASASNEDSGNRVLALVWDLTDASADAFHIDLDKPETVTGSWHYPPTAKFERLLRHAGIPIGFLSNRRELRLIYAPAGETTSHLTFRMDDVADPAGRPIALAMELILHAKRTYGSDAKYTFEGLLAESRRRQADVTGQLAEQVFDAVETLLAGFEAAAARDCTGDRVDWMSAALKAEHVHEGMLNAVLRLVFILYAEDRSLLPVDHPLYAEHFSLLALYERLVHDAGAHPESMHHRFGAYGALTTLFRAIYFGVRHGTLHLPPRQGKLFDPSAYPFLEGGLPDWTAAVNRAEDRAQVLLPSVDDKTIHDVLHGLIVLDGQRLSYRDLSVEQIGAVYESLMGYRVEKVAGPAVRLGKNGVWVQLKELRAASKQEQKILLENRCEVSTASIKNISAAIDEHKDDEATADAIAQITGRMSQLRNRARAGQLVMQPTSSRRSTGSHYTPRSLSERIVRRTLEPVLACLGEAPTANQILQLKICDPAMGSGAFLVEACRFLGERVIEAWRRSGELAVMLERHGEPLLHAKRLVAERCLYGVDKNAAAVELAKLSLWLETLSADKPFTFVDHVLRHGDSLVGLSLEQIRSFQWSPEKQLPTVATLVDQVLAEVREHRSAILRLADDDNEESQREKRRLLELADLAMRRVRLLADCCVGAFFSSEIPKEREQVRRERQAVIEDWLAGNNVQDALVERWAAELRQQITPFHWPLELPETFFLERPDPLQEGEINRAANMDAFVGNPPFMGGSKIRGALGIHYLLWLKSMYPSAEGRGDLSAYFLRRCAALLGANGVVGLIATNSIAQGDTRDVGLIPILRGGGAIFAADTNMTWPGDANVIVSVVHFAVGTPRSRVGPLRLDDVIVSHISSQLRPKPERADPVALSANAGRCYRGNMINGSGFILTPDERKDFISQTTQNAAVIRPYLGGEEVNTHPHHEFHRYVIDFGKRSLSEVSAEFQDLLDRVERLVKPARFAVKDNTGKGGHGKKYWWQFLDRCDPLIAAIAPLSRCLVAACVTKHLVFAWQPIDRVLSNTLFVFACDASTSFAVLQSRLHETWSRLLSSSMKNDLRYAASDCFETFPFPQPDPRAVIPEVEGIGERLYSERAAYMIGTNQGLTQTYNRLKDPKCDEQRILQLRSLHEQMDRAVLDAYGWTDLTVPPFCPLSAEEQTALEQFQGAVIDRLFVLNAQRAEGEKRTGAAASTKTKRTAAKRATKKKATSTTQAQLTFDSTAGDES
jgi:hypothetical protein